MTFWSSVEVQQEHLSAPVADFWISVLTHLDPKYGGMSTVVPQLASSVVATGSIRMGLAAFCLPNEHYKSRRWDGLETTHWPTSRVAWMKQRDLRIRFHAALADAEGVHLHGLWEQSTDVGARTARSLRKPYVLSAHGMLEPWALRNKRWKKRIYAAIAERRNVDGATCLHALTQAEAQNYRDFGSRAPIAVIPNGVEIPGSIDPTSFLESFPSLRGKRILLFLGRLHYKKGLDLLVESWAGLAGMWPDAHLVLAGPDSEGTRATIERMVHERGMGDRVLFTGMLEGEKKWSCLAAAECFILPSYSEGLSTSVLEAMGAGLPVIVTTHCNIPEVTTCNTGWEIPSSLDDLSSAITQILENSQEENHAIGERGRRLVEDRYNWSSVAQRMSEVYRWAAGGALPVHCKVLTV